MQGFFVDKWRPLLTNAAPSSMPLYAVACPQLEQRSASLLKTQTESSRRIATAGPYLRLQGVGSNDETARVGFVVVVVGDLCFCVFSAMVVERARFGAVEITGGPGV